jgi:arylsulfatase A-like enzyme/Tfp pilus assembly protein PilF
MKMLYQHFGVRFGEQSDFPIKKKKPFIQFFVFLGLLVRASLLPADIPSPQGRFNLLLITIDTLRADRLSCYDQEHVKTPNIDSLAEKGIRFTRAFAHNPLTLPSHANILLGTTPLYHGVHDNVNFKVNRQYATLAKYLKGFGYATAAIVSGAPLDSRFGLNQGFDVYDDNFRAKGAPKFSPGERKADAVVTIAQERIRKSSAPWFLWIHFFDPHWPYDPPPPLKTQFKDQPYDGEVANVDASLGTLWRALEESGSFKNTVIVLTSDHGESLGQHGEITHGILAYNPVLWVPLIVYFPGVRPGKIDEPASHIDIFPTVCDVLGLEKPGFLQGVSLMRAVNGEKMPDRKIYFESLEAYYNLGWAPLRGFIGGKEKFIDSPVPELYELDRDFEERVNLANPKNSEKYRGQLAEIIQTWADPESLRARKKPDQTTLETLRSLGYVASSTASQKGQYGPEDDVKILLPKYNRIMAAYQLKEQGQREKGISELESILGEPGTLDIAYAYLARLYKDGGKTEEALDTLEKGLQQHPSSYDIFSLYTDYLLEAGRYDTLIQAVPSKKFRQMEQDPLVWRNLGTAYFKKGDLEKAIRTLETAASIDGGYFDVLQNLGSIYLSRYLQSKDENDLRKARKNFERAVAVDPASAEVHNKLGGIFLQEKNLDQAIEHWERAVSLSPDYGKAHYYLGLAYLSKGAQDKALRHLTVYRQQFAGRLTSEEQKKLDELIQASSKKK